MTWSLDFFAHRSVWDSYTLGIRCPTDGSPWAALAKEPVNEEEQVGLLPKKHNESIYFLLLFLLIVRNGSSWSLTTLSFIFWFKLPLQMDMVATYNETILASNDPRKDLPAGFYTMKSLVFLKFNSYQFLSTTQDNYKRAIRPVLREDRILAIEQKFFCDRTTEKTVTLTARDNQNSQKRVSNSTVRLRCFRMSPCLP